MSIALSQLHSRDRVNLVEPGRLHPAVSFARASTATYMGSGGILLTAAINAPRYEYDASGNYLGLLIEEARTNAFLQSSNLASSSWFTVGSPVRTANAAIAPDGTTSAAKIAASASGSTLSIRDYQNLPAVSYPLQFWLQAGIITQVMIFSNAAGGGTAIFNLTGAGSVITTTGVTSGVSITKIGSYYLCKVTLSPTATGAIGVGNYGSVATGDYFYAWGGQSELGAIATSYIPTTTSAVTRSADVAQATSLSALGINTTAGTFVIQHDAPTGAPLIYSGSNKILDSAGGTKVAIAYDASGTRTSINGATTTTGAALTWSTTLDLLRSATAGANAHVKSLTWYNTKRAASELQRLSA